MIQKSFLFVVCAVILSSCSSQFSLMKRRYTKGFYVASSKKNTSVKHETDSKTAVAHSLPVAQEQVPAIAVNTLVKEQNDAPVTMVKAQGTSHSSSKVKDTNKPLQASATKKEVKEPAGFKSLQISKAPFAAKAAKERSDGELIVMVILCFFWFLNLIAVYMHDDDITLNFWITLLLDFTLIGGIIFSLLVVLDIVDLR